MVNNREPHRANNGHKNSDYCFYKKNSQHYNFLKNKIFLPKYFRKDFHESFVKF